MVLLKSLAAGASTGKVAIEALFTQRIIVELQAWLRFGNRVPVFPKCVGAEHGGNEQTVVSREQIAHPIDAVEHVERPEIAGTGNHALHGVEPKDAARLVDHTLVGAKFPNALGADGIGP